MKRPEKKKHMDSLTKLFCQIQAGEIDGYNQALNDMDEWMLYRLKNALKTHFDLRGRRNIQMLIRQIELIIKEIEQ